MNCRCVRWDFPGLDLDLRGASSEKPSSRVLKGWIKNTLDPAPEAQELFDKDKSSLVRAKLVWEIPGTVYLSAALPAQFLTGICYRP